MRIGMFTDNYSPLINGVVTSIQMLAKGLQAYGHEVFIFTYDFYDKGCTDKPEIYKNNVVILESRKIYIKSLKDFRLSTATRDKIRIIKSYNLDVIHVHTEFSAGKLAAKASKSLHIPLVHTFHTLYDDYLRYFSKFLDKHYKWALRGALNGFMKPINKRSIITIVPTKKVLELAPFYHITGDVRVVPTGIDLSKFLEEKNLDLTEYLKLKYHLSNDFIFVFIGRISDEKSLDTVIKCFAKSCRNLKAKLLIVGNGPALDNIKKLTNELEISKQVVFTGFVDWTNVSDYYKLGDCFVNASSTETQGLTYIEALASGLPLLVKNDECLTDVLVSGVNGVGIDTEEELSSKMNEFVNDKALVEKLVLNTKNSVENYTEMCYARNVLKIYEQAIELYSK